jgi:hypothetical protein
MNQYELFDLSKYKIKNIIIHTHPFSYNTGGIVVQYYLASVLDKLGFNVRLYIDPSHNHNLKFIKSNNNIIFNKFYKYEFEIKDSIVIYGETISGNPLNAPRVVRWILGEVGISSDINVFNTWGKNDLVYYFNSELKFNNSPDKIGSVYKLLTTIYINPQIINNNNSDRNGYCHTMRKSHMHKNINNIHPADSFEITRDHKQEDYIQIFNKHKYFISYDPLTFLSIIASLCGCISIIYPIENISKKEWLTMGALNEYFKQKNDYNLYGIAYGDSPEEIQYAIDTIHLVKDQWNDVKNYELKLIENFIEDIQHFDECVNTVQNNYF